MGLAGGAGDAAAGAAKLRMIESQFIADVKPKPGDDGKPIETERRGCRRTFARRMIGGDRDAVDPTVKKPPQTSLK